MKKVLVSFCMASALVGLSSCGGAKNAASVSALEGEWNIIEIDGSAVVPASDQEFPFIAFDAKEGRVYGHAGCNRLMGSFDVKAKPGTIDLSSMASTKMMCPDMTMEKNVLAALAKVKEYRPMEEGLVGLFAGSKSPVVVLKHRVPAAELAELDGKWKIEMAGGEAIPAGLENTPFLEFNVAESRLNGHAGCNLINGSFATEEAVASSISFPQVASTMMACPDDAVEGRILKALNEVKSFGKLANGGIGLYDADHNLVLVLVKF